MAARLRSDSRKASLFLQRVLRWNGIVPRFIVDKDSDASGHPGGLVLLANATAVGEMPHPTDFDISGEEV